MTPESLRRQFDVVADAPNGVQKLRELILQMAVRGKLVAQDPSDEPASVLLARIAGERKQLFLQGSVGKPKAVPPISADDVPFAVPHSWQWVRLEHLANLQIGRTPSTKNPFYWADTTDGGIPWVSIGDMPGSGTIGGTKKRVSTRAAEEVFKHAPSPAGSLLMSFKLSIGKLAFLSEPAYHNEAIVSIAPPTNDVAVFLQRCLRGLDLTSGTKGALMGDTLNRDSLGLILVPLPPTAEQHRIVAKVDELMALCDELETRQQRRDEARARLNRSALHHLTSANDDEEVAAHWERLRESFHLIYDTPESVAELRQAVLQLAVRGKLVPQDPSDEPASVLLERIAAEKERLFAEGRIGKQKSPPSSADLEVSGQSIPESWEWTRLGRIVASMDSGWSPACPDQATSSPNEWGVLRTTSVQRLEYRDFEHKVLPNNLEPRPASEVHSGDLLITRAGPMNRVGVSCVVHQTRARLMISDKIIRCHPVGGILSSRFIALCLNAGVSARHIEVIKSGMAESQVNISQVNLARTPLPLPPLAEQHRIVAKVDELMAFCDELESRLTNARESSARLATSVVRHLTAA